jgi:hypothetical protein
MPKIAIPLHIGNVQASFPNRLAEQTALSCHGWAEKLVKDKL